METELEIEIYHLVLLLISNCDYSIAMKHNPTMTIVVRASTSTIQMLCGNSYRVPRADLPKIGKSGALLGVHFT